MNKVGLHMGYWRGTGRDGDVFGMLELAASAGVDVYEITPVMILPLSSQQRAELKKAIADKGLVLSINGGLDAAHDIASDDPLIRRSGIEYCKRILEAVAETGSDRWSGPNYSAWLRRPDKILDMNEKNRVRDLSITSLWEIIKTAEDLNITYCFEVLNRFEQFLINTAKEGVAFCEDVGSPNAQLLLDSFHMNIEEDSIVEAILYAGAHKRLGHFHVGESNRRVPGIGPTHMPWGDIFAALQQANYTGYITMEPFVIMGCPSALNICVWRDLSNNADIDKLVSDAREGAKFIRSFFSKNETTGEIAG